MFGKKTPKPPSLEFRGSDGFWYTAVLKEESTYEELEEAREAIINNSELLGSVWIEVDGWDGKGFLNIAQIVFIGVYHNG